jgi:hypothetical protein
MAVEGALPGEFRHRVIRKALPRSKSVSHATWISQLSGMSDCDFVHYSSATAECPLLTEKPVARTCDSNPNPNHHPKTRSSATSTTAAVA